MVWAPAQPSAASVPAMLRISTVTDDIAVVSSSRASLLNLSSSCAPRLPCERVSDLQAGRFRSVTAGKLASTQACEVRCGRGSCVMRQSRQQALQGGDGGAVDTSVDALGAEVALEGS